ncbi:hypothetical protein L596_026329 [Steinernema carpocapsae]|uniref:FAS1 domain-containing protein n=1 Tax=Steinernema carpocapsae TaxID=34508 RepID=A0A4U5M125_STECR|nr:hypothetical protein L596_026329 [Steinernema carpocapsae]
MGLCSRRPKNGHVFKRHVIQGKPLTLTDYRERTFTMMNDEKVIMRRRGRLFQLNWPRVNRVARIIEGREIAGTNGYIYLIDNVLIYEPDLSATACERFGNFDLLIFVVLAYLLLNRQIKTATANCNT